MRKAAIALILVSLAVVAYFGLQEAPPPEPPPPTAQPLTIRQTTEGEVVGFVADGARIWLGIAYASAPVGELRWRAPQPPQPWTGLREATAPGSMCPQKPSPLAGVTGEPPAVVGNEDCLYLNIYAPADASGLPVMFWIHGGGNTIGSGDGYVGAQLATRHDVVVITLNYRLGPLGWFAHPALLRGEPRDDSGNYGTLDIIRALEWTRDNIAAFGGDPGNVTVFGESAGAFNTLAMMASPLAKGLFHRAISQSGGFNATPMAKALATEADGGHPYSSREIVNRLLAADGRAADRTAAEAVQAGMAKSDLEAYLRGTTVEQLFALWPATGFGMIDTPDNFADGHVLPALDTRTLFSDPASHNTVPVMLGTNRDEPSLFMVRDPAHTRQLLWIFPRFRDEEAYLRTVHYGAQAWKARGVDELAEHLTAAGNAQVFAYRFDWDELPSRAGFDLGKAVGAGHFIEVPFVFGDFVNYPLAYLFGDAADPERDQLSAAMMSYWAEFAYTGDPGRGRDGTLPRWQPWGSEGQRSIVLDSASGGGIRMMDELVTRAGVLDALATDPAITDQRERCLLYLRTFAFGGEFDQAEYASLGGAGCAEYDPEALLGR